MPPSPALRCSPGREFRVENHKRGCSLDGGLLLREKDDDLALFNEMQTRERDNFLLHSTDDLDDSLSAKLRYFSDFKLGISIPVQGESSDLLNADGNKNDYDWLLTPPDTPLFPSLDDEMPPVNLAHRGRPRSQPISISRSATTEKSYKTSRSSASPHRLSASPRSGNNTFQSRGRPFAAPHSSPTPVLRPTTPSRSPSTPPNKISIPSPRSSTPTPQKMSTGPSGTVALSGKRGISPVKTTRGNSASPKLRAWQSNIPGFSSDAPPNLRTSLSDRPASLVRGSSPASRNGRGSSPASTNGRESSSKFGRQSMSPTASRSPSSSYSHDRDRFSSQSKGSVASSGDDDIDSLHSVSVSMSDRSAARKVGVFPNSRALAFSKKPSRTLPSGSAPKRSFDSALRQMDRKSPQNMFRPLLSSVPSTTLYVGKANSAHHPMISRNSSVTTSSNASSDQGASVAPDTEGSDHDQDDMTTDWGKAPYPDTQDELFIFDKVDEINEDVGHEIHDGKPSIACGDFKSTASEVEPGKSESLICHDAAATASESLCVEGVLSEVVCHENMATCSKCGRKFCVIKPMEGNSNICPECSEKGGCLPLVTSETTVAAKNTAIHSEMALEENKSFDKLEPEMGVPELAEFTCKSEAMPVQDEFNVEQGQICLPDSSLQRSMVEEWKQHLVDQQVVRQPTVGSNQSDSDITDQQLQHFNAHPSLKVDVSEVSGISVLLKKSSSSKWPVVQGRAFTATSIPCDDLSYARDSANRSSIGHGSASASSSVDWSSSRQTEAFVQRQLSGRKIDMENSRHDLNAKPQGRELSFSGISNYAYQTLVLAKSTSEETFDVSVGNVEYVALDETLLVTEELGRDTELDDTDSSFNRRVVLEGHKFDCTESCRMMDASASELSSCTLSIRLGDTSVKAFPNDDDCVSSGNAEDFPNNARSITDIEVPVMTPESFMEENAILNSGVCEIDVVEDPTSGSSFMISGELENGRESTPGSQIDFAVSPNSKSAMDEFQDSSVPATSEKDVPFSAPKSGISDHCLGLLEESTVTVEGSRGLLARSLTLEEATDTILFCSSIIQDLAYQAATIGMEKENSVPLEGSRPAVTILGKSSSERKDPRGRTDSKRIPKSQKTRRRWVETDVKIETNIKTHESVTHDSGVPNKVNKIDSARPPKLESKCNCTVM